MNTLTLFNACLKISVLTHEHIDEVASYERLMRLYRQESKLIDAIRARLTPPRKRVVQVTMDDYPRSSGYTFASIRRTHDDLGSGYFVSPSSRRRLIGVCHEHMMPNGAVSGVAVFSREVHP